MHVKKSSRLHQVREAVNRDHPALGMVIEDRQMVDKTGPEKFLARFFTKEFLVLHKYPETKQWTHASSPNRRRPRSQHRPNGTLRPFSRMHEARCWWTVSKGTTPLAPTSWSACWKILKRPRMLTRGSTPSGQISDLASGEGKNSWVWRPAHPSSAGKPRTFRLLPFPEPERVQVSSVSCSQIGWTTPMRSWKWRPRTSGPAGDFSSRHTATGGGGV